MTGDKVVLIGVPGKGLQTLYRDDLDLERLLGSECSTLLSRASHINPVPGPGIRFQIEWQPPFLDRFGERTLCDEEGKPFTTKKSAEECEVRMILRDYYGIPLNCLVEGRDRDALVV